jgi:uncharacterized membrane protein YhaH (DUF805 family)
MSFTAAIRSVLSQYAGFAGRARRSEYWWFALLVTLISIATSVLDSALDTGFGDGSSTGFFGVTANLVLLLPSLAVAVRRLHDTDRSGWWLLIALIPLIGLIVLLVLFVQDGTAGTNRFGPSPKHEAVSGRVA